MRPKILFLYSRHETCFRTIKMTIFFGFKLVLYYCPGYCWEWEAGKDPTGALRRVTIKLRLFPQKGVNVPKGMFHILLHKLIKIIICKLISTGEPKPVSKICMDAHEMEQQSRPFFGWSCERGPPESWANRRLFFCLQT